MTEETTVETQATELLRTLIRNGCVNTGDRRAPATRSAAWTPWRISSPARVSRVSATPPNRDGMSLITRIEGRDGDRAHPAPDGPHRRGSR